MYIGLPTSDILHKKSWRIGSGLGGITENLPYAKFACVSVHKTSASFAGTDLLPLGVRLADRGPEVVGEYLRGEPLATLGADTVDLR
jgi:hypothetical protein